jgi:WD40 repeat protein
MAVAYADGDIAVFPLGESAVLLEDDDRFTLFSEHTSPVTCLAVHPGGHLMASGGSDNLVILWDLIGRTVLHKFVGHGAAVTGIKFFKHFQDSGDYMLTTSKDGSLRVWCLDTRRCVDMAPSKKNEVLGLAQVEGLKFVRNSLFLAPTNAEEVVFFETIKSVPTADTAQRHLTERGRLTRTQFAGVVDLEAWSDYVLLASKLL